MRKNELSDLANTQRRGAEHGIDAEGRDKTRGNERTKYASGGLIVLGSLSIDRSWDRKAHG